MLADVDDQLPVLDRSNTLDLISTTYFARHSSSDQSKLLFRVYAHTQGNKLLFQVLAPVTMANIFLFVLIHQDEVNYEILSGVLFVLVFGYSVRAAVSVEPSTSRNRLTHHPSTPTPIYIFFAF